jgi:predicted O-methyltransferase YrrM
MGESTFQAALRLLHHACFAPLGARKVRRMLAGGLPGAFREPLEFLFTGRLDAEGAAVAGRVEAIREEVARRTEVFEVTFSPGQNVRRTGAEIARRSSVDARWGAFLCLCARSFGARAILELGSCAGISGSYLASSRRCERFVTVEASPALAALARENIGRMSDKATVINALFDDVLDEVLPTFREGIDLAYIDGHHDRDATWRYFKRILPRLREGSLVVFDDIHWSKGMWEAWRELRSWRGVSHAVDVGRFGLCHWDPPAAQPRTYSLAFYAGWLPGGRSHP